jgi:hypothetical protein
MAWFSMDQAITVCTTRLSTNSLTRFVRAPKVQPSRRNLRPVLYDSRRNCPGLTCTTIARASWTGAAPTGSSSRSLIDVCPFSSPDRSLSMPTTLGTIANRVFLRHARRDPVFSRTPP